MKKLFTLATLLFGMMSNVMADDIVTATYGNATGNTERTLTVALNHTENYCAFQLDLTLPTGTTVDETKLTAKAPLINGGKVTISGTEESTDFVLAGNTQSDGKYRIIGYNLGNASIGTGDVLLTIPLKTTNGVAFDAGAVTASNVTFVNSSLEAATLTASADQRLWGDVIKDGNITTADYQAVANMLANVPNTASNIDNFAADVDQNNEVGTSDYQFIANKLAGNK